MLRLKIFGRFRAEDSLGSELPIKSKKARAISPFRQANPVAVRNSWPSCGLNGATSRLEGHFARR
jgi:hypothetical protein